MARVVKISKNRHFLMDLLSRAQKFHCPVSTSWAFDVTDLDKARREVRVGNRPLGMTACLVKATALTLRKHPNLNRHLFTGLFRRYLVAFDTVACTVVVIRRGPDKERILLPLLIEDADTRPVTEIQFIINEACTGSIEDLPQLKALERLRSLPRPVLSLFSYRSRSDHRFYRRYFGTYGLAEMAIGPFGPRGGSSVANTASAFNIGPRVEVEETVDGRSVKRLMQGMNLISDHYIVDGIDILEGMRTLKNLLRDPAALGVGTKLHD